MEFGLYSFGDLTADPATGKIMSAEVRLGEVLAQARLLDEAGLDAFALGEHHRLDFAISATTVVLAAIAAQTKRIKLGSAVTILGTADPVRVYQDYATIDLLSGGRAELTAGRGIYTESFPLFGHSLEQQDAQFAEHLRLLIKLNESERVSWQGERRASFENLEIAPRPTKPLTIWLGTGGTIASAERAGKLGLPMSLGNITLPPEKLVPAVDAYRAAGAAAGHKNLRVGIAKHLYIVDSSQAARDEFFPYYAKYLASHSTGHYLQTEVTREIFEARAAPDGPLYVGSPQEVVDKIARERKLFGYDRVMGQTDIGGLPFAKLARSIELLATKVKTKV